MSKNGCRKKAYQFVNLAALSYIMPDLSYASLAQSANWCRDISRFPISFVVCHSGAEGGEIK